MTEVEIRPARQADLALLVSTFGEPDFFTDRLARQLAGLGVLLTAWSAGEPLGDVYVWLEPADEPEVREYLPGVPLLNHVEVEAGHRNRGIGSELVRAAEDLLVARGHEQVALAVRTDNLDALRLYERLGYRMWSHGSIVCMYVVRLPDGSRKLCPETCNLLVKQLRGSRP